MELLLFILLHRSSALRRMDTLAAARYGLRDIDGLNQADSEDPAVRASMTHALSLLDRFGQDIKGEVRQRPKAVYVPNTTFTQAHASLHCAYETVCFTAFVL